MDNLAVSVYLARMECLVNQVLMDFLGKLGNPEHQEMTVIQELLEKEAPVVHQEEMAEMGKMDDPEIEVLMDCPVILELMGEMELMESGEPLDYLDRMVEMVKMEEMVYQDSVANQEHLEHQVSLCLLYKMKHSFKKCSHTF